MSKNHLIEVAAKEANITKAAATRVLNAVLAAIVESVAKNEDVKLIGFGTFKTSKRLARTGRNPQTGKEIKIAATTVPRFTPGATFKSVVATKNGTRKK
jgi:DNA-binding protein HU-beta